MHLHGKTARRYAKALYDLAAQTGVLEPVLSDLGSLRSGLVQSPELARFLGNYILPRSARREALTRLFTGKLHPLSFKFLMFLEAKKRLGRLVEIDTAFQALYDEKAGIVKGRLTSAFPMDPADARAIAERVRARVPGTIELAADVAPALLGGFRLRVDDLLFDLSLATRLQTLRRRIRYA